jgi:hypothetical protein
MVAMEQDQGSPHEAVSPLVADAAAASSAETVAAIERAAAINDDPEVGEILDQAVAKADQTVSRVGWLRGFLHRLFGRSA